MHTLTREGRINLFWEKWAQQVYATQTQRHGLQLNDPVKANDSNMEHQRQPWDLMRHAGL